MPSPHSSTLHDLRIGTGVVGNRFDLLHRHAHIVLGVERHGFGLAATAITVGAHRIAFGDAGSVHQHHQHQVGSGGLRVDRPAKPALHQQGHPTDMVDVGMAEDQRIKRARLEREGISIAGLGLGTALDHAAIEQQPLAGGFDLMQRAGDLASSTMENNAHLSLPHAKDMRTLAQDAVADKWKARFRGPSGATLSRDAGNQRPLGNLQQRP